MATGNLKASITFISAGAGSGKTHRLTEILHQELIAGHIRPSGVVATTFTKKAAAELRERVRAHLLRHGSFNQANAMGQARIGTVNSVCGQLIARFAFEAGLSTDQQVLEDAQSELVLARAMDAVLDGAARREWLTLMRRLGLDDVWKDALRTLVNLVRSNDIPLQQMAGFAKTNADDLLGHFPTPSTQDLDADLLAAIQSALPKIQSVAQSGGKQNTNSYLELLKNFAAHLQRGDVTWGEWVKLAKSGPEAGLRDVVQPIADLAARVDCHPGLHADLRRYLEMMFGLVADVLSTYQTIKQEMGALDFADQEHQLLRLLDHPEVASVLDEELDLLMVDEFQDTSPIQLALFLKLARFAKKVYWVGDIKQAIYGFRGSDTELMQAILRELPALGGTKEVLPSSWRSRKALVQIVNAVFTHAFADSLHRAEIILKPERTETMDNPALANWMLGGKNVAQEAAALASGVRRLLDEGYQIVDKATRFARAIRYGDVAVLSRSNDGVQTLATALSEFGIPVAIAQAGLLKTPEAVLAMACLRRLNDPGDTVATAEMVSLADSVAPEIWLADRLAYLEAGGEPEQWLERAIDAHPTHPLLDIIAGLRSGLPILAPREALSTVITRCALADKIVRWTPDANRVRQRLANLESLIKLAEQYEDICRSSQHAASISGLILWLGELAEQEQDILAEPAIDAVKVMTHHAAKGLEWPVVILTDLAKDIKTQLWSISAQSGAEFDVHHSLANRFIRYWPWPFGQQKRVGVADAIALTPIAARFKQAAIEEAKRLLYVSMTRARDLLVLARSSRKPSGEWLDCIDAPWLLPSNPHDPVQLPSGETIPAYYWELAPVDQVDADQPATTETLYWFNTKGEITPRLPLGFTPSSSDGLSVNVLEKCRIGSRIPVVSSEDMSVLGTAIHACIGLAFTDPNVLPTEAEITKILTGFDVLEQIAPLAILQQIQALRLWLNTRWPDAKPYAEMAVQHMLSNRQVLNGRVDLLLDTEQGWVLIDHKSSQLAADHWDQLASEYGMQMAMYAQAIEQATGRPVIEKWLFLPVAGGAVRIDV